MREKRCASFWAYSIFCALDEKGEEEDQTTFIEGGRITRIGSNWVKREYRNCQISWEQELLNLKTKRFSIVFGYRDRSPFIKTSSDLGKINFIRSLFRNLSLKKPEIIKMEWFITVKLISFHELVNVDQMFLQQIRIFEKKTTLFPSSNFGRRRNSRRRRRTICSWKAKLSRFSWLFVEFIWKTSL